MADSFKILGQADPADTNEAVLYTVPAVSATTVGGVTTSGRAMSDLVQSMITSIIVCNLTTAVVKYRIRLKEAASVVVSCVRVNEDKTVTTASTANILTGVRVSGTGVTAGTTVDSVTGVTSFEMSVAATASGTSDLTFSADDNSEFLFYDAAVPGNKTHVLSLGLTLSASNLIKVRTNTANQMSFTAMGIEVG